MISDAPTPDMDLQEEILSEKADLAVLNFRAHNYEKAILLLSEIVRSMESFLRPLLRLVRLHYGLSEAPVVGSLIHPKLLGILDQRAASYEKVKKLKLAHKDVAHMLALDPTYCKAHLRLGKLYLKEGRDLDAYKAFQMGVFTIERAIKRLGIEVSPKLLGQLKQQYSDLNRTLKEKNRPKMQLHESLSSMELTEIPQSAIAGLKRSGALQKSLDEMLPLKRRRPAVKTASSPLDPFVCLPLELLARIFEFLPTSTVLRCHLVSRLWYSSLTSIPHLYTASFHLRARVTAQEYLSGAEFIRKLTQRSSLRVRLLRLGSTKDYDHLDKILGHLFHNQYLNPERVEIVHKDFNFEVMLRKLEMKLLSSHGLSRTKYLRLGVNSFPYGADVLLAAFPNVEKVDVIGLEPRLRTVAAPPRFSEMVLSTLVPGDTFPLKSLAISNNANVMTASNDAWMVRAPPVPVLPCPNLEELRLVGFEITPNCDRVSACLARAHNLRTLYFEDCYIGSLFKFFELVQRIHGDSRLLKFTVRENMAGHSPTVVQWDDLQPQLYSCFTHLQELDIYGCDITSKGLQKVLDITNINRTVHTVNLGRLSLMSFQNDTNSFSRESLSFATFFRAVPHLKCLVLAELDLDDLSMRLMAADLTRVYGNDWYLEKLDLSFCTKISGVGLVSLVSSLKPQLRIGTLVMDGTNVNVDTLKYLRGKGLITEIQHDPYRLKWSNYGVNSYIFPAAN